MKKNILLEIISKYGIIVSKKNLEESELSNYNIND